MVPLSGCTSLYCKGIGMDKKKSASEMIMHELKAKGLLADTSAITVDEAKKSILEALEKRKV